jgi:hypothetical protein
MTTTAKHNESTAQRSLGCKARWRARKNDRVSDLKKLFTAHQRGDEDNLATLGTFAEYGLGFDYVAPGTFVDAPEGYWRYQISWGGPSDEFRFYASRCGKHPPYRIEVRSTHGVQARLEAIDRCADARRTARPLNWVPFNSSALVRRHGALDCAE